MPHTFSNQSQMLIKMAGSVTHVSLVLLAICVHFIYQSMYSAATQNSYSPESLVCKIYNMTKMDCSNRNLPDVPRLDQNLTTSLDLSKNLVNNITCAPFQKLQALLMLNLSYNEISHICSTAFRGLESLESLDLEENMLVDLPKDIFSDLHNLVYLNLNFNWFTAIPDQVLTPLRSLQYFSFLNGHGEIHEMDMKGLETLINLNTFLLFVQPIETNISSDTIYPLRKLPLTHFAFHWFWSDHAHSINKDVFQPLTSNISVMSTTFTALHVLPSLQNPCQTLIIESDRDIPKAIDTSSLQVLQKWNTSLETLFLCLINVERVEDYAFIWIPNLHVLNLSKNKIDYLAKDAFYGLYFLQQLILSKNSLTHLPSDALEVFRKSASLKHLDFSSNGITKLIDQEAFSAVSTSLLYLNVDINYKAIAFTNWIGLFQNLKSLTLTFTRGSIFVNSDRSLPSLQTIRITNFDKVTFQKPLCILFPSVKVNRWSSYSQLGSFPLLEAIEGCFNLNELDLSGVLQKKN